MSALPNYPWVRKHMRLKRGAMVPLVAFLLWSSACQGGQPKAHTPPAGSPSASASNAADTQRCQRLAKRGFTPCPPPTDRLQLPPTTTRNATNGAVADATVQEWGRSFQLAQAYYYWAMQHNARDALTSGVLAESTPTAIGNLFGSDLMDLDRTKQQGGELLVQPLRMPT